MTDVPTPYRVHLFDALDAELRGRDIDLEVVFLAGDSPMRAWTVDLEEAHFRHRIAPGWHPRWGLQVFHVNPGVVRAPWRRPPTWLLVGGSWTIPTIAALLCAAPHMETTTVLWAEANPASTRYRHGAVGRLRAWLWRRAGAYAVPGDIAAKAISALAGDSSPIVRLPNVVDERAYRAGVDALRARAVELRTKWRVDADHIVVLWPARLNERDKGIVNFLRAAGDVLPARSTVLIAGDGPDRAEIARWIEGSGLPVRLIGHATTDEMLELFAIADVFLLPSLLDPNPLSAIEALWAGLPVIVSDRCGNWPEVVPDGQNGWVVDPTSPSSMRAAISEMASLSLDARRKRGARSRAVAEAHFDTATSATRFVDQIEALDGTT